MDVYEFTGRHYIANYLACDLEALMDSAGLTAAMERAVRASGATLLQAIDHTFSPSGFTLLMLLSESHASIHTYPEHRACFVDLFTCGHTCVAERFHDVLKAYLRPAEYRQRTLLRDKAIQDDWFKTCEVSHA